MTALELKQAAKVNTKFTAYYFTESEMQAFVDQLCKEQLENVLKRCHFSSDGQYYFATKEEILTAEKPDGI